MLVDIIEPRLPNIGYIHIHPLIIIILQMHPKYTFEYKRNVLQTSALENHTVFKCEDQWVCIIVIRIFLTSCIQCILLVWYKKIICPSTHITYNIHLYNLTLDRTQNVHKP
jgi:hypothetical protein